MISEIEQLVNDSLVWLRDKTSLRESDGWVEITTPYFDRHNDFIQFYVRRENGGFLLTDDGYILDDLELSGCKLDSPKRRSLLNVTLNGFGVRLENNALQIYATKDNFPMRKHNLVQAMLAVNDMFYLTSAVVTSLFLEDVTEWLKTNAIRFISGVKLTGHSGFDHRFDFVIPASQRQPDRFIRTVNHPTRSKAESAAFACIDTIMARPGSLAFTILNDEERVSPAVIEALRNYETQPILWSQRRDHLDLLAA